VNAAAVKLLTDNKGSVTGAAIKLEGGDYAGVSGEKLILACVGGINESPAKGLPVDTAGNRLFIKTQNIRSLIMLSL